MRDPLVRSRLKAVIIETATMRDYEPRAWVNSCRRCGGLWISRDYGLQVNVAGAYRHLRSAECRMERSRS